LKLSNPIYLHFEGRTAIFVCNSSTYFSNVIDGRPNPNYGKILYPGSAKSQAFWIKDHISAIVPNHISLDLQSDLFPSGFPTKILYAMLTSFMHFTTPLHLIILVLIIIILIILIIFGEEYNHQE
jgi:hypothetical protein